MYSSCYSFINLFVHDILISFIMSIFMSSMIRLSIFRLYLTANNHIYGCLFTFLSVPLVSIHLANRCLPLFRSAFLEERKFYRKPNLQNLRAVELKSLIIIFSANHDLFQSPGIREDSLNNQCKVGENAALKMLFT